MLCLTREIGEWIVVGTGRDATRIQIAGIRGNKVRLAIDGPQQVDREEVRQRKEQEHD